MGFLVFGQVTRAFEFLVAAWLAASFGSKLGCGGRALTASHGPEDGLVLLCFFTQGSLEADTFFAVLIKINWLTSSDGDGLSVFLDSNKFSWSAVLCESTIKFDLVRSERKCQ